MVLEYLLRPDFIMLQAEEDIWRAQVADRWLARSAAEEQPSMIESVEETTDDDRGKSMVYGVRRLLHQG